MEINKDSFFTIISAEMDVATDDATFDEEVELDFITNMGQTVPRFADMITGYATNPGTSHYFKYFCFLLPILFFLQVKSD